MTTNVLLLAVELLFVHPSNKLRRYPRFRGSSTPGFHNYYRFHHGERKIHHDAKWRPVILRKYFFQRDLLLRLLLLLRQQCCCQTQRRGSQQRA